MWVVRRSENDTHSLSSIVLWVTVSPTLTMSRKGGNFSKFALVTFYNIAVFWSLLTLAACLSVSSEAQQAGKSISGPSFPVNLSCCLWDNLLCQEPVPESVVCKASLATNSQQPPECCIESCASPHCTSSLIYFVPMYGSVA